MEVLVKVEIGESTKEFLTNLLNVKTVAIQETVAPMVEVPKEEVKVEVIDVTPVEQAKPVEQAVKPSITRDELKAYCSQRKNNDGVDITKILNEQFGVTAFKFLTDDKLQAFYEAVSNA